MSSTRNAFLTIQKKSQNNLDKHWAPNKSNGMIYWASYALSVLPEIRVLISVAMSFLLKHYVHTM